MTLKEISRYLTGKSLVFNPKDYGAVGDGSTDDIDAFEEAIGAMPANGGVLWMPAGDFVISRSLNPDKPIHMMGSGKGRIYVGTGVDVFSYTQGTRIISTDTSTPALLIDQGLTFTARDFSFVYGGTTPSSGNTAITFGGTLGCPMPYLSNIGITDFYDGIRVENETWEYTFDAVTVLGPHRYGFYLDGVTNPDFGDLNIINCIFRSHRRDATAAIYFAGGGGVKITSLKVNARGNEFARGIDVNCGSGNTVDFNIVNASIEGMLYHGIRIQNGSSTLRDILISGVQIGHYSATQTTPSIEITGPNSDHFLIQGIIAAGLGDSAYPVIQVNNCTEGSIGLVVKETTFGADYATAGSTGILRTSTADFSNLPLYDTDAEARAGGLVFPDFYRSSGGVIMQRIPITLQLEFDGVADSTPVAAEGTITSLTNIECDGAGGGRRASAADYAVAWAGTVNCRTQVTIKSVSSTAHTYWIQHRNEDGYHHIAYTLSTSDMVNWYFNVYKRTGGAYSPLITQSVRAPVNGDVLWCQTDETNVTIKYVGGTAYTTPHSVGGVLTSGNSTLYLEGGDAVIERLYDEPML